MIPFQAHNIYGLKFCNAHSSDPQTTFPFPTEHLSAPPLALDDLSMRQKDVRMSLASNSCILHTDTPAHPVHHPAPTSNSVSSLTASFDSHTKSGTLTPTSVSSLLSLSGVAYGRVAKPSPNKSKTLKASTLLAPSLALSSTILPTISHENAQPVGGTNLKSVSSTKKWKTKKSRAAKSRVLSPFTARRKTFLSQLLSRSARRGYLTCKLCSGLIWGPNGRYHMETCEVLCAERKKASAEGIQLHTINGIEIHEELFAQPKVLVPKAAKIPGFVMSSTVLRENQYKAPTRAQQNSGEASGRKGYVRCLACNTEVFAPNTRRHAKMCWYTAGKSSGPDGSTSLPLK